MDTNSITQRSTRSLQDALAIGELSSREICQAFLQRIDQVDSKIRAFIHVDHDRILAAADESDKRRSAKQPLGPNDGIPVGIKDLIAVEGDPLGCASKMLENFVSPYDATVTTKLKNDGWIPFGRLNMDEFAMGSSTENSARQKTANPWDLDRIPGGSSGGSAAAVAARECPISLGSDTGGSIRQPASHCGIVGLKPTYGRVSRFGLVAFASSLDQIGPMGNSVEDVAILLESICGHDSRDSTSAPHTVEHFSAELQREELPARIGLPKEYFGEGMAPEVRTQVESAIEFYRQAGCEMVEIDLPHTDLAVPTYYIIATAEASSNLARFDGVRYGHRSKDAENAIDLYFKSRGEGFGPEVKRRIMLGTYVLSSGYYDAWYLRAQKTRTLIRDDFMKAFENVDVILTPTCPSPAFKFGEKAGNPLSMYLEDTYTISANLAGLPAMSIPCGISPDSLPIGFQLIASPFAESDILRAGHRYQQANPFNHQPNL